jgi:hypothetical protein
VRIRKPWSPLLATSLGVDRTFHSVFHRRACVALTSVGNMESRRGPTSARTCPRIGVDCRGESQIRSGRETVVATAAAFEAMKPRGLVDKELNGVADVEPRGHAPKQGDAQTYVEPSAASAARETVSLGRRVHDASVLAVVAAAQVVWLSVLGYGLFSLLS